MMELKGLVKLVEECGELVQIAAKKMACMDTDEHWDGKGSIKARMEEELADVQAACQFVADELNLDWQAIHNRIVMKYVLFREWNRGNLDTRLEDIPALIKKSTPSFIKEKNNLIEDLNNLIEEWKIPPHRAENCSRTEYYSGANMQNVVCLKQLKRVLKKHSNLLTNE